MRGIESSLRRLQTDQVDLYQVHGWDSNTPLEETLRTLDDLVRHGKVRHIGLSNLLSWQAATAIMLQERMGLEKYVTAQMYYNLVGRGLEYEFQSFAQYRNIGVLVWSSLAGGFLSGKYARPAGTSTPFQEQGSPMRDSLFRSTRKPGIGPWKRCNRWRAVTVLACPGLPWRGCWGGPPSAA